MKTILVGMMLGLCAVALAAQAQAQGSRKPGLYEVTTSMTMTGMPQMPQMAPHTMQVCVTQAVIDKYGGPAGNPQSRNCQMTNVVKTATGMTAKLTCSSPINMTGTVQTTFVDANTIRTVTHMTMTMSGQTVETSTDSTYTYKGPDCGSVKPPPMPPSQ